MSLIEIVDGVVGISRGSSMPRTSIPSFSRATTIILVKARENSHFKVLTRRLSLYVSLSSVDVKNYQIFVLKMGQHFFLKLAVFFDKICDSCYAKLSSIRK